MKTTTHRTTTAPRGRRRRALAALALTAGLFGSACSGSGSTAAPEPIAASVPASPTSGADGLPATTAPVADPAASEQRATLVVRSTVDLAVHDAPDPSSPSRVVPATNDFGSALALLVVGGQPGWAEVLLPGRPTGATGWLDLDASGAEVREVTTAIEVDLAAKTLTVTDGGEVVLTTPVAIGTPEAPTPTGVFSVTDKLQDPNPNGPYGPFALGLSGRSEVLTDFAGGDGQIGIHGTNDPSSIGTAASHGCIRVPNEVIVQLNELLPLGTPVVVR